MLKRSRGQSTLEYALIIAVVVGALLAMQVYMKRGMEGRMRKSADDIGKQFEADQTYVQHTTVKEGATVEVTQEGGTAVYSGQEGKGRAEKTKFSGTETVDKWTK